MPLQGATCGAYPQARQNWVTLTGDKRLLDLDPEGAVYLDTETTGLAGGTGVYVYMVGLARFVPQGVEVWQGFMRGPEQEAALLEEVRRRIALSSGVVSFFGKSFDRHRLEDKMKLHAIDPPFSERPHLDLYHPLRRLHQGLLGDSKLQTMERHLCGVEREQDLPGSLAPEAWFDYLGGRAHRLHGVFQHNFDDVLSLMTLTEWLARVDQRILEKDDPIEWQREAALASGLTQTGQKERALQRLRDFHDLENGPAQLWLQRAQLEYDQGLAPDCLESLRKAFPMPVASPDGVRALNLASKTREHRLRDFSGALSDARAGLGLLAGLRHFSGRGSLEAELEKRAKRTQAKCDQINTG